MSSRSNTTLLEQFEQEVERRVADGLVGAFFASEVERHARNGHRTGCDCSYCRMKARATAHVTHAASRVQFGPVDDIRDVHSWGSCNPRYTQHWLLLQNVRDAARREARAMLLDEKERLR